MHRRFATVWGGALSADGSVQTAHFATVLGTYVASKRRRRGADADPGDAARGSTWSSAQDAGRHQPRASSEIGEVARLSGVDVVGNHEQ